MMVARSVEAIHAFYEAQNGLGENPPGSNANWITKACGIRDAWCVMTVWVARIAAGFNPTGQILDFGSPQNPPAWAASLPNVDGVGFGSTYRWGSAYVWAEQSYAEQAGRWTADYDEARPGDSVCINHNGRGGTRNVNSHLAEFIAWAGDGSALTWNGNVGNQICQARWSRNQIEGFCHPELVSDPSPSPSKEDEMFSPSPHPARQLTAAHSGLLLACVGREAEQGTRIITEEGDGLLDQRWMPWGHPEGNMSLVCRNSKGEFKALDVPNGDATAGVALQSWEFNQSDAQRFTLEEISRWEARVVHVSGLRVDVAYSGGIGSTVQLWSPNDGGNQVFRFTATI